MAARTVADGKWVRRIARTAADGVGAREWLEMGGEKKPLVMSELGCADGCGGEMDAENCADGCGRRGGGEEKPLGGENCADGCRMGGEKKLLEISELGCADGCGWEMGAENCADGCGRRGCKGAAGNGRGEEAPWRSASLAVRTAADGKWVRRIARTAADGVGAREWLEMGGGKKFGDQQAWLHGRLWTANGWGELRGRLRPARVPLGGPGAVLSTYKCIARLKRFYNLLTKCCNLPYKCC